MLPRLIKTRHRIPHPFIDDAIAVVIDPVANLDVIGLRLARRPCISIPNDLAPFKTLTRIALARTPTTEILLVAYTSPRIRQTLTLITANCLTRIPLRTRPIRRRFRAISTTKRLYTSIDAKAVRSHAIAVLRAKRAKIVGQRQTRRPLLINEIPFFASKRPALRPLVDYRASRLGRMIEQHVAMMATPPTMLLRIINPIFVDKIFVDLAVAIVVEPVANLRDWRLAETEHPLRSRTHLNASTRSKLIRDVASATVEVFIDKPIAVVIGTIANFGSRRLRIASAPQSIAAAHFLPITRAILIRRRTPSHLPHALGIACTTTRFGHALATPIPCRIGHVFTAIPRRATLIRAILRTKLTVR